MAQANKNYHIEVLNGNNYYNWKFRMEMILAENGVLEYVEAEIDISSLTTSKDKEAQIRKDSKAKSLIIQCVDDNQLECLRDKKTAFQMWKTLNDRYEKKGLPGQLYLKKKLLSMKLKENESLETFIQEFEEVVRQLKATETEVSDQDLICNILLSLPKSYETLVTVIENMPGLTFEIVKKKLISEYEKRKLMGQSNEKIQTGSYAFSTQGNGCFRCGEVGHFKKNCPKASSNFQRAGDFRRGSNFQRTRGFHRGTSMNRSRGRSSFNYYNHRSNYVQQNDSNEKSSENQDKSVCFIGEVNETVDQISEKSTLKFFIDSGCTDHMISEKHYFSDLLMLKEPIKIAVAKSNSFLMAMGVGNIKVLSIVGKEEIKCTIKNVFYVPQLRKNLLSVKKLEMMNIKVIFENCKVKLMDKNNRLLGIGKRTNLYEISFKLLSSECLNVESLENEFTRWHRRYAHIGFSGLKEIIKQKMVIGINENIKLQQVDFCEPCINGKMTRIPFGIRTKSSRILEIVHSDVCGPVTPESYDGNKYFVTFIDDFSNFTAVYFIKRKSEVFEKFREYLQMVESKFSCKLSKLRCDNGGEYCSNEFVNYCKEKGIILDYTIAYTPQQNGKAERKNRSLVERARALLDDSGVPKIFWGEAVKTANYVMNRGFSANLKRETPAEVWYKSKPNVSNFRIFGCVAYSHIPRDFRDKFDVKTEKCIMLGYAPTGYRLWSLEKQKLIVARDVEFDENSFYFKKQLIEINQNNEKFNEDQLEIKDREVVITDHRDLETENNNDNDTELDMGETKRSVRVPSKYNDYELYMAFDACSFVESVPNCFNDLENRVDRKNWLDAVDRELKSIEKNNTWKKVSKPNNTRILDTKWVFSYKGLEDKDEDKYKARLVVRGFAQEKDKNYDEIYSPVAKMITIRGLLIIGNQLKYYFQQLDVKTAFLNGTLTEDIYIFPPQGVHSKTNEVFKLKKSLYGLKQSSKCWNDEINNFLLRIGFIRSENDHCLYILYNENKKVFLLIYVDDIILAGPDLTHINEVKNKLMKGFLMKDKGPLKHFLGLEILYDRENGILKIHQCRYIKSILKRFCMDNCKGTDLPIDPKLKIELCTDPDKATKNPFRELVGCIMYLMLGSRPDICFSVNFFSRFQDKASDEAWNHLKRVLRYLKNTVNVGLEYKRNNNTDLHCYVDSDWGGDTHDRKSVTGFVFKIFGNAVMWVTRKQNCVSLSTTEAELIALCTAVCDGLWLKKLFLDLGIKFDQVTYFEDNQGCLALIKNPTNNRRVKHIDLKFNFICEHVKNGNVSLIYVDTKQQQADIFTKGLSYNLFVKFKECLNLRNFSEEGCRQQR